MQANVANKMLRSNIIVTITQLTNFIHQKNYLQNINVLKGCIHQVVGQGVSLTAVLIPSNMYSLIDVMSLPSSIDRKCSNNKPDFSRSCLTFC